MCRMLNLIAGAYRSFDPGISGGYYRDELTRMVGKHGRAATEAGLRAALRDSTREDPGFAPSIPVILGYVQGEANRGPQGTVEHSRCPNCQNLEGWVYVEGGRVKRCRHEGAA